MFLNVLFKLSSGASGLEIARFYRDPFSDAPKHERRIYW